MAAPKKSFADGFTIESLRGGSDSGPTDAGGRGTPRTFGGAPTLFSINRGEKALADEGDGAKRVYPPTYGGGKRQITTLRSSRKGKSGGGYVPSASDITNSPNPF